MTGLLLAALLACDPIEPDAAPPSPGAQPADTPLVTRPVGERPERVAVRHVLVSYTGAVQATFSISRTREEARRKAEEARARILAGAPFEEVAGKMSDDPSRARGGFLGSGEAGTWTPKFEDAAFSLPVGGLSGVIESPFGFHVIQRDSLEEVHLRHLVVQYEGALRTDRDKPASTRSVDDARLLASEALAALDGGQTFEAVAERYSDGPMGLRGADLGWFLRGELGPAFDAAAFDLDVGAWSRIVETPFGLHIIQRVE